MKTIIVASIFVGSTALAVYGHQNGYLDVVEEKVVPFLKQDSIGILDKDPRHIVIGLDITAGREGELDKDRAAIGRMIKETRLGDKVEVYLIHSRAESEQESVFSAEIPENSGPAGQDFVRAKQKAEKEWEACWDEKVVPQMDSGRKQQTDLFGFMRYVTSQKPEFQEHKHPNLVLFTDGQQVGDGFNMEKRVPTSAQLKKLKEDELIPELNSINIRFAGVTPTHKVTNAHWRKLQAFWKDYSREAGAETVAVTSDRKIQLK